jgi:hypothetical protein
MSEIINTSEKSTTKKFPKWAKIAIIMGVAFFVITLGTLFALGFASLLMTGIMTIL